MPAGATPPTRHSRSTSTRRRARCRRSRSPARRARRCAWSTCSARCCAAAPTRFDRGDRKRLAETKRLDTVLDRLNSAIKSYLTALEPDTLDDADDRRLSEILAFSTNIEHAGDFVDRGLMALAGKRLQARPCLLGRGPGRNQGDVRPARRQLAHRRRGVHDQRRPRRPAPPGRGGSVPRPRSPRHRGAFRRASAPAGSRAARPARCISTCCAT